MIAVIESYKIKVTDLRQVTNNPRLGMMQRRCPLTVRGQMADSNIIQFSSVAQSCPTLCDPMNYSTPGLPVHHQLPEFTQLMSIESVMPSSHRILCRPLLLLPPNPSQHQGLFQWVNSSHEVAKVLEFQLQHQFLPMNSQDWSPLGWTGWISLQSKGLSRVFSNTIVQKHQFFSAQLSF